MEVAFTEPAALAAPSAGGTQAVNGSDAFDMDLDVQGSLDMASRCYIWHQILSMMPVLYSTTVRSQ